MRRSRDVVMRGRPLAERAGGVLCSRATEFRSPRFIGDGGGGGHSGQLLKQDDIPRLKARLTLVMETNAVLPLPRPAPADPGPRPRDPAAPAERFFFYKKGLVRGR
ncbi:hypothetical protein EVAR_97487_1 [Eumeta japonica]|uniref:Uncharacterized protein n=1 Tax=Eumeta variegata TaxID=151549 RepID=A0A4C1Z6F7_EUMVA|nr:hypothetical protein EVAR_97487_1 [Eumeta japonica]